MGIRNAGRSEPRSVASRPTIQRIANKENNGSNRCRKNRIFDDHRHKTLDNGEDPAASEYKIRAIAFCNWLKAATDAHQHPCFIGPNGHQQCACESQSDCQTNKAHKAPYPQPLGSFQFHIPPYWLVLRFGSIVIRKYSLIQFVTCQVAVPRPQYFAFPWNLHLSFNMLPSNSDQG